MRTLHVCACALALAGCVEPEDRSTDFEYLHAAIIEPSCATVGCHSRQTQQSPEGQPPLDLSTPIHGCAALAEQAFIPPPNKLIDLLEGDFNDMVEPVYRQMPPDVPLPAADIELIRAWIDEGAPCD